VFGCAVREVFGHLRAHRALRRAGGRRGGVGGYARAALREIEAARDVAGNHRAQAQVRGDDLSPDRAGARREAPEHGHQRGGHADLREERAVVAGIRKAVAEHHEAVELLGARGGGARAGEQRHQQCGKNASSGFHGLSSGRFPEWLVARIFAHQ